MTNSNMLENKEEETPISKAEKPKRIGAAKGKFTIPENFDEMDKDIENMFEGYL